jgi:signal transduction histidine kinase/PAS domain-containing protein/DNA-binding NarL/FixJ family response regulator
MMEESRAPLEDVLVELLQCDPRATFMVELPTDQTCSSTVAFANAVLTADQPLYRAVQHVVASHDGQFWRWIVDGTAASGSAKDITAANNTTNFRNGTHGNTNSSSAPSSTLYLDSYWTRSVYRHRYVIVGRNEQRPPPSTPPHPHMPPPRERSHTLLQTDAQATATEIQDPALQDFSVPSLTSSEQEEPFVFTINSFDWSATPLGPMATWPPHLTQTFNQVLADSRPIAIYWGPQLTVLYNEAFSKLCGVRHPSLLGRSVEDAWPDVGEKLRQTMQRSASKRRALLEEDWRFFVEKADGSLEETHLNWSVVPIMPDNLQDNVGFLQPVNDTTSMRLWERRMKMLIDMGESLVMARDTESYWRKTIESFEACNPAYDVPLVVLYSVQAEEKELHPNSETWHRLGLQDGRSVCHLEGSLGVPRGHPLAPQRLDLHDGTDGLSAAFREAIKANTPTVLSTRDGSLPKHLLDGVHWRGFQDPCHEAIVYPIRPTKDEPVMGILVLGLNPRRPYDHDYQQFISLLGQKLTTTLASTVLLEEETRRHRNVAEQAAYDRARLKEKLAFQTREANDWVSKFQAVAELSPVGMCFGDLKGEITFANEAWYLITGLPKTDFTHAAFLSRVLEEDRPIVSRAYDELEKTGSVALEFRVYRDDDSPLQPPIGSSPAFEKAGLDFAGEAQNERYISAALKAETAEDGTVLRVLSCMTDVTMHKKAAYEAIRRASQADNLKKMADSATVGMYEMTSDGRLIWANSMFFEMCGLEKVKDLTQMDLKPFETCVVEEDLHLLHQTLEKLTAKGKKCSTEIRFNTPYTEEDSAGNKIVAPRCMLALFRPVKTAEGGFESFTGCLVDMTLQRRQFEMERQHKDEAIESKRQQEHFIDMTSHEMRNPLSAIVQCADSVVASNSKMQELACTPEAAMANWMAILQLAQNCIDNAETIDICAQHQRHIVDDILTMSKMDSDLLTISPATVDPKLVAKESLKMFEVEARRVDINLSMTVDPGYYALNIEFLDLDPSRLRQVLINLLTNALKFTKTQATRNVSITLSASKERPTDATSSVQYIPQAMDGPKPATSSIITWPDAEVMYLIFEVKDTGQGLTAAEKASLFQRFVQASPKTHVKYGGSGLGLFISKRLTEMLGGQIGVASQPGRGSTFAFYVAATIPGEEALNEARLTAKTVELSAQTPTAGFHDSKSPLGGSPRALAASSPDTLIKGVLIVEDNLINQQITRRGLLDKGYNVEVANHGLEALEKLKSTDRMQGDFPLGVVMMDMEMPIQDGLTCTRTIRQMEKDGEIKGPKIPIIAVSANARTEQIQEAMEAGCDDVLVKPYKIPELTKVMHKVAKRLDLEEGLRLEEEKKHQPA